MCCPSRVRDKSYGQLHHVVTSCLDGCKANTLVKLVLADADSISSSLKVVVHLLLFIVYC